MNLGNFQHQSDGGAASPRVIALLLGGRALSTLAWPSYRAGPLPPTSVDYYPFARRACVRGPPIPPRDFLGMP